MSKGSAVTISLAAYIMADPTVVGIIEDRLYNIHADTTENTPYVVMSRIATTEELFLDGPSGMEDSIFQLALYAETVSELDTLRDALNDRLNGFRGTMGTVEVGMVAFGNEVDGRDSESDFKFKILDYRIVLNS